MSDRESLKWQKLLWSAIVLLALGLLYNRCDNRNESLFGMFGLLLMSWSITIWMSAIVLILRLFRLLGRENFIYIFTGSTSLILGIWETYINIFSPGKIDAFWLSIGLLTLGISIFILIDVFVEEIPGFRKLKN
jgi:hypothetical protein